MSLFKCIRIINKSIQAQYIILITFRLGFILIKKNYIKNLKINNNNQINERKKDKEEPNNK